jgi:hypothetical protein
MSKRTKLTDMLKTPEVSPPKLPPAKSSKPDNVMVYVANAVQREIKLIALDRHVRPNVVYLEAIDLLLERYGRKSVAELSKA